MPKNLQAMQCARKEDWTGLGIRRALLAPEKDVGGPTHFGVRKCWVGWGGGGRWAKGIALGAAQGVLEGAEHVPEPQTMRGHSAREGYIGKVAAAPKVLGQRGGGGKDNPPGVGGWG